MAYKSDIEIAQQCQMKHITEIAKKAEVDEKFGPILDGLFTGKTQEVIYREGVGANIYMHFCTFYMKKEL